MNAVFEPNPPKASQSLDLSTPEALIEGLRAREGFRMTPQREKIIQIFFNLPAGEHLSAESLFRELQKTESDVSLATSYRTLNLLAELGVLRELDFAEDHKHYELAHDDGAPHHHLLCLDCGLAEEFELDAILPMALDIVQSRGFKLKDIQLKLFANCIKPDCNPDDRCPLYRGH
ncbi:MAG: Fur family transcriptional regulator [Vampirovibrionales bacterium]|nr:Fur family transcriptional regulator [Vampirovibrionales bacterium]